MRARVDVERQSRSAVTKRWFGLTGQVAGPTVKSRLRNGAA